MILRIENPLTLFCESEKVRATLSHAVTGEATSGFDKAKKHLHFFARAKKCELTFHT